MTHVVIDRVIGDDLIDTFLGQLIGLSGLDLKHRSFLLCSQDLWVLRVDVHSLKELIDLMSWEHIF